MSPDLDLLKPQAVATASAPARRSSSATLVAGVLVLGALAWAFMLLKPSIFPARRVETVAVRVEMGAARAWGAGQACRGIEPHPISEGVRPQVGGTGVSIDGVGGQTG